MTTEQNTTPAFPIPSLWQVCAYLEIAPKDEAAVLSAAFHDAVKRWTVVKPAAVAIPAPTKGRKKLSVAGAKYMDALRNVMKMALPGEVGEYTIQGQKIIAADLGCVKEDFFTRWATDPSTNDDRDALRRAFNRGMDNAEYNGYAESRNVDGEKFAWITDY